MKKLPRAMPFTNHIVHWTFMGVERGYPPCCIGEFILWAIKSPKEIEKRPDRKLHGTGFVPCIKCNCKSEEMLIAEINRFRSPELMPFPDDSKRSKQEAS